MAIFTYFVADYMYLCLIVKDVIKSECAFTILHKGATLLEKRRIQILCYIGGRGQVVFLYNSL